MSLTKAQRDLLLQAQHAAEREFLEQYEAREGQDIDTDTSDALEPFKLRTEQTLQAYWDALPRLPISACPYCGAVLRRAFDPWGIDGFFWQEEMSRRTDEPEPCAHFGVLVGAVNLNGLPPHGGMYDAHLGPEVPFVIPRVLSLPGMIAVVSTLSLENGYTTYPIAYFADPLPEPFYLTHPWGRTTMGYRHKGQSFWTIKNDPWDFELEPWVASRQLRWIAPDDADLHVRSAPEPCPYVGLPGRRQPIVIEAGDVLRVWPVPDGSDVGDPFE